MDTASYCVKAAGKCSDVRCNICPRYMYAPSGYSSDAEPEQSELFPGLDPATTQLICEAFKSKRSAKDASECKGDAVVKPAHYAQYKIEPINFIMRNDMPFWMGNVIKYVVRADQKNGVEDLRKAIRYIEFRIRQLEGEVDITA